MLLLLTALARADAPQLVEISAPFPLLSTGGGGTWPRLMPDGEGGWRFFMANGGDLYLRNLDADFAPTASGDVRTNLTNHGALTDHGLALCDDGGLLDASSSQGEDYDDTLIVYRWDADLQLISETTLAENAPSLSFADAATFCSSAHTITGGFMYDWDSPPQTNTLFALDDSGALLEEHALPLDGMSWFGGAWGYEPELDQMFSVRAAPNGPSLFLTFWDPETFEHSQDRMVNLFEDTSISAFWPVRIIPVGDHWMLPIIVPGVQSGITAGTGDVYLVILDEIFDLVSVTPLTDYGEAEGAIQPWIVRSGSRLVLSWTYNVTPYAVEILLSLPPVADAGEDQSTAVGTAVTLDGSGSADEDGEIISWSWALVSAPDGAQATLSSEEVTASFTPDVVGEYILSLTVSDGELSGSDTLFLTATEEELSGDTGQPAADTGTALEEEPPSSARTESGCGSRGRGALVLLTLVGIRRSSQARSRRDR